MCNHIECKDIRQYRLSLNKKELGGIGILFLVNYYQKQLVVGLGLESHGKYKRTYNLCSGKLEKEDNNCYLKACERELFEEFKIYLSLSNGDFNKIFKNNNENIRYFMHYETPIFIGIFDGYSRTPIKNKIQEHLNNSTLNHKFKEIIDFEYFDYNTQKQINGYEYPISSFASAVIKKSCKYIKFDSGKLII